MGAARLLFAGRGGLETSWSPDGQHTAAHVRPRRISTAFLAEQRSPPVLALTPPMDELQQRAAYVDGLLHP
jgi:hypothetical protein